MPADDEYDDFENDEPTEKQPNWRRSLESKAAKAAKAAEEATARAEAAERRLAFAEAGVNISDPKAKWFVKGYDGDLTADAIKAAAGEAGLVEAPEASDEVPAEEQAAHARLAQGQGTPPGARDYHAEMNAAETEADLLRVYRESGGPIAEGAYFKS